VLRLRCASRRIEPHYDSTIEPRSRQKAQLVVLAGKLKQRVLRPQEQSWMRGGGQGRGLSGAVARARLGGLYHGAMPAMNAIEITDRHHGAGERPGVDALRTAAHNMELSCRHTGLVHRFSDRLKQSVVRNLHMFSLGRPFGGVTVS